MNMNKPNFNRKAMAIAITTSTMLSAGFPIVCAASSDFTLEEVVVTATRRAQSIQDIPYNISSVSSEGISDAGAGDMADLMKIIPGVVFADSGPRGNSQNSSIVLRGLNVATQSRGAAFANLAVPTVSTYMDDTPIFLNLNLSDIERVEVLRGPQGTLYGSGSLAGTVRFIHKRPDTNDISGSVGTGVEFLGKSDDQTYSASGVFNYPLSDNIALRVSATYEDAGGVIDAENVFLRDADGIPLLADDNDFINSKAQTKTVKDHDIATTYSIRSALLWEFSDNAEALFVYHHQNMDAEGNSLRNLGQNDYVLDYRSIDEFKQDVNVYSLEVEADLGFATITSTTSYSEMEIKTQHDVSYLVDSLDAAIGPCALYGCYPRGLFAGDEPSERQDFTQEFRLVSNGDSDISWIAGAYYNEQKANLVLDQTVYGYAEWANAPGSAVGVGGNSSQTFADYWLAGFVANPADEKNQFFIDRNVAFEDTALYGEVSWQATDAWQLTFGTRYFEQEYSSGMYQIFSNCGVFCAEDPTDIRGRASSSQTETSKDQIFKFNTSYELSADTNMYFTWAQGFRHGGANALPVGAFGITQAAIPYEADETINWEVGVKGYFADNRFGYTLSAFLIEWDKPQMDVFVSDAFLPAVVNGEEAESRGIEAELNGRLTENLTISLGYNYTDAQLTKDFNVGGITGLAGSELPGVAKNQANITLDYLQPLNDDYELHYHLNGQYKGKANNALKGSSDTYDLDAFALLNTALTLEAGSWSVTAFINNILNEHGAVYGASITRDASSASRPRSFGLRTAYNF